MDRFGTDDYQSGQHRKKFEAVGPSGEAYTSAPIQCVIRGRPNNLAVLNLLGDLVGIIKQQRKQMDEQTRRYVGSTGRGCQSKVVKQRKSGGARNKRQAP